MVRRVLPSHQWSLRWLLLQLLVVLLLVPSASLAGSSARRLPFRYNAQFFKAFRTSEEIYSYMKYLSLAKVNCSVSILKIGYSYDGRPIRVLRISGRGRSGNGPIANAPSKTNLLENVRRGLLVTSGVHGREWISPMAVLYAATRIIEAYGSPKHNSLTNLLDYATLHFVPIVNPDGFKYTWNAKGHHATMSRFRLGTHTGIKKPRPAPPSRLWRGNRHKFPNGEIGVDLNRNWGSEGISWGLGVSK